MACCWYLDGQKITAQAVDEICHVMGGFKPRKKGERVMNLEGFNKVISKKGVKLGKAPNCLLVSEKSRWFGFGKQLVEEHSISKQKRADLFIKKTSSYPEIIIRLQNQGVFAISNAHGNFGIRSNTPFKLYKNIQGIYSLEKTENAQDGFYMKFKYKEAYGK